MHVYAINLYCKTWLSVTKTCETIQRSIISGVYSYRWSTLRLEYCSQAQQPWRPGGAGSQILHQSARRQLWAERCSSS